jgi:hypothetical protein
MRLVGCGLLALSLLGQVSAASGSSGAYDPQVIVRYQGTFTSFAYTASSIDMAGKATFASPKTESWKWTYSWVGKLSILHQRRPFKFTSESMNGTVRRNDTLPGGRSGDCVFTYEAKPKAYPLDAPVQVPFSSSAGYSWKKGAVTFIQFPPPQASYVGIRSASDPRNNGHCRTFGPSPAMAATFPPSMGKVFRFTDLSRPLVRIRRFDRTFKKPGGQPAERETLRSSVTLDIGVSR